MTVLRSVLVAGLAVGGAVLQDELKDQLGRGPALVLAVMLSALAFALLENISVLLIQRRRFLRRAFLAESRIEGWWTDVVLNKKSGQPEYGGVIYITFADGALQVSGTTYGVDGHAHGTFRSIQCSFSNDILEFSYNFLPRTGEFAEDPGFARYSFRLSDGVPKSFAGFFLDSFNVMSMTIEAVRVTEPGAIAMCNEPSQQHLVFMDHLRRVCTVSGQGRQVEVAAPHTPEADAFRNAVLHFARREFSAARTTLQRIEPKRALYDYAAEYVACIEDNPAHRIPSPFDDARAFEVFNSYLPELGLKRRIAKLLAHDLEKREGRIRLGCVGPGDGKLLHDCLSELTESRRIAVELFEPHEGFAQVSHELLTRKGIEVAAVRHAPIEQLEAADDSRASKLDVVHCVFSLHCVHPVRRGLALKRLRKLARSIVVVEFDDAAAELQGLDPQRIQAVHQRFVPLIQAIVDGHTGLQSNFDSLGITSFLMPVMFGYFLDHDRSTFEQSCSRWRDELKDAGFQIEREEHITQKPYIPAIVIWAS